MYSSQAIRHEVRPFKPSGSNSNNSGATQKRVERKKCDDKFYNDLGIDFNVVGHPVMSSRQTSCLSSGSKKSSGTTTKVVCCVLL